MGHNKLGIALVVALSLLIQQSTIATEAAVVSGTDPEQKSFAEQGLEHWYKGDFVTAINVLIKADAEGDIKGTIALSQLYHFSSEFDLALPLLLKAETAEDMESMLTLVEYYEKGLAMEKPNLERARAILNKLVGMNYPQAMMFKAESLERGRLGIEVDFSAAFQLYEKLADLKYLPAINSIYETYQYGSPAIKADIEQAKLWRQRFIDVQKETLEANKNAQY